MIDCVQCWMTVMIQQDCGRGGLLNHVYHRESERTPLGGAQRS
jgi:hypothetical protein